MNSRGKAVLGLSGVLLCSACGGQSNGTSAITRERPEVGEGGSSGAAEDSPANGRAGVSAVETGGAGTSRAGAASGDSLSDAGERGYAPFVESGTRACENSDYCFGLDCYAPSDFQPAVCVAPCQSDADCAPAEACVHSSGLAPTCYARCDSPSDCNLHFDCFDYSGSGLLVCFPASWASRRRELGN